MADNGFVLAVSPGGQKRRVPKHYLEPPFNFRLAPSQRVREPAAGNDVAKVTEPAAKATNTKEVTG